MIGKLVCTLVVAPARRVAVALAAIGLLLPVGCTPNPSLSGACAARTDLQSAGAFLGSVGQGDALIGLDFTRCPDGDRLRIFVTDGAPFSLTEYFEGAITGNQFSLVSANGQAQIEGELVNDVVEGVLTPSGQAPLAYRATPATHGAGLYEVAVGMDGRWTGSGPGGAQLVARQRGVRVEGAITDAAGNVFDYGVHDLSRVFDEPSPGGQPDTYFLIVGPGGHVQLGRGGVDALRTGQDPGAAYIRLDLPASDPTPGIYFGRLQDLGVLVGLDLESPDANGIRRARALISDGIPLPQGHTEWFADDVTGATFSLASKSGNAGLTAVVGADGISGVVTFADGVEHPYFAAPAGEGAGIYEATIDADGRLLGTSQEGGVLDLQGGAGGLTGTLTTPGGEVIPYQSQDLLRLLEGHEHESGTSVPGRYVLLAGPRGEYLVGSPGDRAELVVIAIIAIIIAPLLPSVQKCPFVNKKPCCSCETKK